MTTDIRKNLPDGVNAVDMNERGDRSGPLSVYGHAFTQKTIHEIFKAWNVKKWRLVNHTGNTFQDGFPDITRANGPIYMLLFGDGKWRYVKFGGLNGPPWSYCPWDGAVEAPNGESAWLLYQLAGKIRHRVSLEVQVTEKANEIAETKAKLAESLKAPTRSDGEWTTRK